MTEETLRLKIKELNTTSDQSYKELLELKARTIEEWQRQGQALPKVYGLSDAIDSFKTDYNSRPQLIFAAKSSYNDIELSFDGISEAHKQSKKIYVVVIKGKRKIFRPFTEDDIATTLAASTLDKLLNTHIAPRYSMAEVNGTPGILGEYIEGTFSPTPVREDLQKWLVQKHGQKKALSAVAEAQVFAFLVENSDLHRDNIKINSQGRIMFFDHGSELSFEPQVLTM
ncbi:MAG: hypothetical protein KDD40_11155, partial [Bdellovibrionales bacterium]|nr:hypothetical protein [Bdellovibrionales bacterium]